MLWISILVLCLVVGGQAFTFRKIGGFVGSAGFRLQMGKAAELKAQLVVDMREALKAKEKVRLNSIRAIQSAFKQKELDDRVQLTDEMVSVIMGKLIKQRKESIASYTQCNRLDLAEVEQQECDVILSYLPKQLSAEEIDVYIKHAIKKVSATTVKDMGNVMAELKPFLMGKADMNAVGNAIRQQLSGK